MIEINKHKLCSDKVLSRMKTYITDSGITIHGMPLKQFEEKMNNDDLFKSLGFGSQCTDEKISCEELISMINSFINQGATHVKFEPSKDYVYLEAFQLNNPNQIKLELDGDSN